MSIIRLTPIATPANAPTGKVELFIDSADGLLKQIDDAGTVTEIALDFTPENVANKKTTTSLGSSDTFYPTQKAVKTYVDNAISALASVYQALLGFTPEDVANKTTDGTLAADSDTLYPSEKAVKTYVDSHGGGMTEISAVAFSGGTVTVPAGTIMALCQMIDGSFTYGGCGVLTAAEKTTIDLFSFATNSGGGSSGTYGLSLSWSGSTITAANFGSKSSGTPSGVAYFFK